MPSAASLVRVTAAAMIVSTTSAALAQAYPPDAPDYPPRAGYGGEDYAPAEGYGGPQDYPPQDGVPAGSTGYGPSGYGAGDPAQGDGRGYAPPLDDYDDQPPAGYDGSQPPPPPPGYQGPSYAPPTEADRRYEAYAEDWAQRYCRPAPNHAGQGAVIGGLLGALVGVGVAGRHGTGAGAALGGVAGAAGGAVVGSGSRNATSPGCPPGYVVHGEAPAFAYDGYGGVPYAYAAPAWYRPWTVYGGRWIYRPYPYHVFYHQRFGYGRGFYGRPYGHRRPYGWRPYRRW